MKRTACAKHKNITPPPLYNLTVRSRHALRNGAWRTLGLRFPPLISSILTIPAADGFRHTDAFRAPGGRPSEITGTSAQFGKCLQITFESFPLFGKWHQIAFDVFPQVGKCLQIAFDVSAQSGKWHQIAFDVFPQVGKCLQTAFEPFPQVRKYLQIVFDVSAQSGKCFQIAFDVFPQSGKRLQIAFDVSAQVGMSLQMAFDVSARGRVGKSYLLETAAAYAAGTSYRKPGMTVGFIRSFL